MTAPPSATAPADFDRAEALARVGGDVGFLEELLALFQGEITRLIAEAREAARRGDAAALRRLAHTAAGAAEIVAAPGVAAAARRLESGASAGAVAPCCDELGHALHRFRDAVRPAPSRPAPTGDRPTDPEAPESPSDDRDPLDRRR